MRSTTLLASVALLLSAPAALAADFGLNEIDMATSQWDGPYVGVLALGYYSPTVLDSGAGAGLLLGINKTLGDNFLVGGEIYAAYETNTLNPPFTAVGLEGRAGIIVTEDMALYGALGGEVNFSSGGGTPSTYVYLGGGVELMATEDVSIDLEIKSFMGVNNVWSGYELSGSVNWHF